MSPNSLDPQRLETELAQVRAALHDVQPLPPDEAALRAAFRAKRREREQAVVAAAARVPTGRVHFAAAAAVLAAVVAVVWLLTFGVERPLSAPTLATEAPAAPAALVPAFQPLLNSPGLSPSGSYSVVRVRIPLSSLALVPGTEQGGSIEADLLVGEDGLARGIRFNPADVAYASADLR